MSWEEFSVSGGKPSTKAGQLIRAVMGLHTTFKNEVWLWRGQADGHYGIVPAMHTRIQQTASLNNDETSVVRGTRQLLQRARRAGLDKLNGINLPDLALLAHLQHHGAATPLLDVTVDPLVALWMVAFSDRANPDGLDDRTGYVFGVRRPPESRWLLPFDSRAYATISETLHSTHWYRPPDVSERLRIQRGSFLLAAMSADDPISTVDLGRTAPTRWLGERVAQLGQPGRPRKPDTDVVAFKIQGRVKRELRSWLEDRAGLSPEIVYPTPWHRPFLDEFCAAHGRLVKLDLSEEEAP